MGRLSRVALAVMIACGMGVVSGWVLWGRRPPAPPTVHQEDCEGRIEKARASVRALREVLGAASTPRERALHGRVTDLETQLFATRLAAEIEKQELVEGRPHEWDESISERWRPEAWNQLVQNVLQKLARDADRGVRGRLLDTDCEEFPCISHFEVSMTEERMASFVGEMSREFGLGEEIHGNIGWDPKKPEAPGYMTLWGGQTGADGGVGTRAAFRMREYWDERKRGREPER